ncbi:MAG: ABC transporter ATP-binding protein [Candidatus Methylomirabilales bacterium]
MLEVRELSVHYRGALALQHVSLSVAGGEAVSLIGPNGAGKTSLLRAISGLVPYEGDVRYAGRSLRGLPPDRILRAGIVHCPEAGALFGEMTVAENLEMGAYTVADRAAVRESLEQVYALFPQLRDRAGQLAGTLSGGERQMLALGRSLMSRPTLLMLDEPSLGLSPLMRDRIQESIERIHRARDLSIILVEQDSALALEVGQRVYVLDSGRLVREGPPEAIAQDPAIREVYLGIT